MKTIKSIFTKTLLLFALFFSIGSLTSCNNDHVDELSVKTVKIASDLSFTIDTTSVRWAKIYMEAGWLYQGYYTENDVIINNFPKDFTRGNGATIPTGVSYAVMANETGTKFYSIKFDLSLNGDVSIKHSEIKLN